MVCVRGRNGTAALSGCGVCGAFVAEVAALSERSRGMGTAGESVVVPGLLAPLRLAALATLAALANCDFAHGATPVKPPVPFESAARGAAAAPRPGLRQSVRQGRANLGAVQHLFGAIDKRLTVSCRCRLFASFWVWWWSHNVMLCFD